MARRLLCTSGVRVAAVVVAWGILFAIYTVARGDFLPSDPLWYAEVAHRWATAPGELLAQHDTHPFVMRVGLTLPLAALYGLFGVSAFVSNLPCMIAAYGIVALVVGAAATPRGRIIAAALCLGSTPLVANAMFLNIDLPCAALMALTVACLWRRRLVAAVFAWLAAFLVKETALWCAVVWLYAFACDARATGLRAAVRRYLPAALTLVVLAALYAAACAQWWGSPLARFQGVDALAGEHAWSLQRRPLAAWLARLTWQPAALLATMFGVMLVPVAVAPWHVAWRDRIWLVATGAFALLYWFGPTSLAGYEPLPISARMVLPVLPGVLVVATLTIEQLIARWPPSAARTLAIVAFAIAVAVPAEQMVRVRIHRHHPEESAFAALGAEIAASDRRFVVVCAEPRCVTIAQLYFGFEVPARVTIVDAADFAAAPRPEAAEVRVLIDRPRARAAARPIEALALPTRWWDDKVGLGDAGDGAALWQGLRP